MAVDLAVLGVPSSAGAHHAGQDLAPGALRERGLIDRLRADGLRVVDVGDVAGERWTVDAIDSPARNLTAVVDVALAVADAVERECRAGRVSLVLGGDCTITLGVVAGLQRVADDVRLAYFDGDADLNSPDRTRSGVLDATGVAHLLGIATTPLAQIGRQTPMLRDDQLVLLGYDPTDADSYEPEALTTRPALRHASDAELRADPIGAAQAAVESLTRDDAMVAVHFDVDAVDSRDLPLANFPHYGTGVPLGAAGQILETLIAAPGLAAVVLTEVNPTHDPTGAQLDRYIETVTTAIARGLGGARPGTPADDPFGGRRPTSHERMTGLPWDASYQDGPAPWDVGRPQPAVARLAAEGGFAGAVLDVGCGTGENALHLASLGLSVLGVDVAGTALAIARAKAEERGIEVGFAAADALQLERLGRRFATVLDCGMFHTLDGEERPGYVASLASVTERDGTLYVLCFGDEGPDLGPHPVSRDELRAAFDSSRGWRVAAIEPDRVQTRFHDDGAPAWLATIRRR